VLTGSLSLALLCPPGDRLDYLVSGIFLDEVPSTVQHNSAVLWESPFEADSLGFSEGWISISPQDEHGKVS
jgi:hypothetical protein